MAKTASTSAWEGSRRFRLELTGLTGLLFHNPAARPRERPSDPEQWEIDHFREMAYYADGRLVIPEANVQKCLIQGAAQSTLKPAGGRRSFSPLLQQALMITEPAIINRDPADLQPLSTLVNGNPSKGEKSGVRIIRTRPVLMLPWKAETTCEVFDERLTRDVLLDVGAKAGRLVGIIERSHPAKFGRFTIDVIEI